jgi:hypothetical protein
MENVMMWETKNVLVLLAVIAAFFSMVLWLGGANFSCAVCDVIMTMLQ